VNAWLLAALALLIGLVLCGLVCVHGTPMDRLVGLEMAGTVNTLILIVLAEGYHQAIFFDLAVVLALLSFAGGLVFARLLERWL
jgi:multicomponent Na+:H+ antiporter subunit F